MKILPYTLVTGLAFFGLLGIQVYNPTPQMIDPSVQIADYCSGTVIDDPDLSDGIQDTILTAKHCTKAVGDEIKITIPEYVDGRVSSQKEFTFKVTHQSESDVALLQRDHDVNNPFSLPHAAIYDGSLEHGTKYWVVGYPMGLPKLVTEGYLGWIMKLPALSSMSKSTEFRLGTAAIAGGNSGGGIFVKNWLGDYELAGTVSAGIMNGFTVTTNLGCYTPLEEIQAFLKEVKNGA